MNVINVHLVIFDQLRQGGPFELPQSNIQEMADYLLKK